MPVFQSTFPVAATADEVWAVLADLDAWSEWNPSVPKVSGEFAEGSTVKVTLAMPGRPSANVKAIFTELDPGRRFVWHGNLGADWFFRGTRTVAIDPEADGTVQVTHIEDVGGAFFPVFKTLMGGAIQKHHDNFNDALRRRAEG